MPRDTDHVCEDELVSVADSVRDDVSPLEDVSLRAIPSLRDADRPNARDVLRDCPMPRDCPDDDCDPSDRVELTCSLCPRVTPTRLSFRGRDGRFGLLVDGRYCWTTLLALPIPVLSPVVMPFDAFQELVSELPSLSPAVSEVERDWAADRVMLSPRVRDVPSVRATPCECDEPSVYDSPSLIDSPSVNASEIVVAYCLDEPAPLR